MTFKIIAPFLIAFYGLTLSGSFSLGKLLAVALCGLWLALGKIHNRDDRWPLAYLAALAVSAVFSADPWVSIFHLHGTFQAGLVAAFVIVPFWACVGPEDRAELEMGLRWGCALMAVVGLGQAAVISWLTPFPLPAGHRVYSTMGSPVYVGAMVALCFPFLGGWIERAAAIALTLATGSRGAYLAIASGILYQTWPLISERVRYRLILALGAGLVLTMYVRPPSDLGRVVVWDAAWQAFKARPWLGWGPGNYLMIAELWRNPTWDAVYGVTTQDYAHNLFLEAASTSGILGLVTLSGFLWHLWSKADRPARAAILGVFVVGLLNPLPVVVKALAVALCASCSSVSGEASMPKRVFVKKLICISFVSVMCLVHWDRMMTYYGKYPWSFSSVKAAAYSGVLKQTPDRRFFKL